MNEKDIGANGGADRNTDHDDFLPESGFTRPASESASERRTQGAANGRAGQNAANLPRPESGRPASPAPSPSRPASASPSRASSTAPGAPLGGGNGAPRPAQPPRMRVGRGTQLPQSAAPRTPDSAKAMEGTLTFKRITPADSAKAPDRDGAPASDARRVSREPAGHGAQPPTAPNTRPAASAPSASTAPSSPAPASASRVTPARPESGQEAARQPRSAAQTPQRPAVAPQDKTAAKNAGQTPESTAGRAATGDKTGRPGQQKEDKKHSAHSQVVRFGDENENSRGTGHSGIRSLIKALVYIAAVLIVSVVLGIFGINIANDVFAFVKEDDEMTIEIPEYMTTAELADILYENGIIKYPLVFKIYNGRNDNGVEFVAGTYTVSTNTSYDELFSKFQKSTVREVVRVTIPEGYTTLEVINLLVENGIGTKEGFTEVIDNYDFSSFGYRFLEGLEVSEDRTYRLEGYLYPDTYDFYKARGITADDDMYIYTDEVIAITKFLDRFDLVFTEELYDRIEELGMTTDEVVTLASLVEKEGKYVSEFEDISSVFHNRLKYSTTYPKLQSDATISYAIMSDTGTRPEEVKDTDKYYDNPYNTYLCDGLPPGPIANPGYNAITCALYPSTTNYFFFVSTKSGTNLFASTLDEHTRNINIARGLIEP